MSRDAFGPNLRRIRMQRKLSIERIADATKVPASLFEGLERNDFSNWPAGVYARAYVRQYAEAIGVDGDSTVDEFCRWFPNGDRRIERIIREQAEIVGHDELVWEDTPPGDRPERRGVTTPPPSVPPTQSPLLAWFARFRRVRGRA
jgi:transcriptional regulator with XRE-family HTH domain